MKIRYALAAASFALASPAMAQIVQNGGFESPVIGSGYVQYDSPSSAITGWSVTGGSVDIVRAPSYIVSAGSQALDLNGLSAGTISQTLSLTPNQAYVLSFFYSNNGGGTGTGTVSVGNLVNVPLSHSGGTSYTQFVQSFIAGPTNTLTFASTNDGSGGLFLDAINISAAPEPATWAMMIGGFGMAGVALRRRKAQVRVAHA